MTQAELSLMMPSIGHPGLSIRVIHSVAGHTGQLSLFVVHKYVIKTPLGLHSSCVSAEC